MYYCYCEIMERKCQVNNTPDGSVQHPQAPKNPLANYQFSSEEMRVLRECNSESFFQRSLPIGSALGFATYFGVKRGFLTPNSKYGAVPKVVVSVIFGYFAGKFSYQRKCVEKFMKLPNSRMGQILRERKLRQGGAAGFIDSFAPDQGMSTGFGLSPFGSSSSDVYSDINLGTRGNSLDLDTERPSPSGLDDSFRLTLDSPTQSLADNITEPQKPSLTYDDLRNRNREEYEKKSQNRFNRPLPPGGQPVFRSAEKPAEDEVPISKEKNKYGDVWT